MNAALRCGRACVVRCLIALWLLVSPVPAIACELLDVPWPTLLESATDVFIGRPLQLSGPVGDATRREMAEILKYLEGLSAGRPQAVIHLIVTPADSSIRRAA